MRVIRVPEGEQLGKRAVGQRCGFGIRERRVRAGGAAYRLRGVVDEDVERASLDHRVGEADDLGGIAQVDADDSQAMQPIPRIGKRRETAHGIARESRRDGRVRAIPEQAKRDVHSDLGSTPGEQRAPATEIGAGITPGVVLGGAVWAELVVERVDLRVVLLADVAGTRLDQRSCGGSSHGDCERDAAGLVVDAV